MPLTIGDKWLPATLTAPAMTDEEFAALCASHPDLTFEVTASGKLVVMRTSDAAFRKDKIRAQLEQWARSGTVRDSAMFQLRNGARRSPDVCWIASENAEGKPASPDFVIELRSDRNRLPWLREKMFEWVDSGTRLVWMIDPERKAVEILRPGRKPEVRSDVTSVEGEGPVAGFVLDLASVWASNGA